MIAKLVDGDARRAARATKLQVGGVWLGVACHQVASHDAAKHQVAAARRTPGELDVYDGSIVNIWPTSWPALEHSFAPSPRSAIA